MKSRELQSEKLEKSTSFFFEIEHWFLLEEIEKNAYTILKEFKNDKRTYVARILLQGESYILKKIFYPKKIKSFFSKYKLGEGVSTLVNLEAVKERGITEVVNMLAVRIYRDKKRIVQESCIMPYCEGDYPLNIEEFLKVEEFLKKIHAMGYFHGDCNPGNFLLNEKKELYVIDTKLKKMFFGNYRAHYDILTLQRHFCEKKSYPYYKNLFYYFAVMMRKIRNFLHKIKDYQKKKS